MADNGAQVNTMQASRESGDFDLSGQVTKQSGERI